MNPSLRPREFAFTTIPVEAASHLCAPVAELTKTAALMLGLRFCPAVHLFMECDQSEAQFFHDQPVEGMSLFFSRSPDVLARRPEILVRFRPEGDAWMVPTIGHECRHVWQWMHGWDMTDRDLLERDAEKWALSYYDCVKEYYWRDVSYG